VKLVPIALPKMIGAFSWKVQCRLSFNKIKRRIYQLEHTSPCWQHRLRISQIYNANTLMINHLQREKCNTWGAEWWNWWIAQSSYFNMHLREAPLHKITTRREPLRSSKSIHPHLSKDETPVVAPFSQIIQAWIWMRDVIQGTPFPANAVNALFLQETYTKPSQENVESKGN